MADQSASRKKVAGAVLLAIVSFGVVYLSVYLIYVQTNQKVEFVPFPLNLILTQSCAKTFLLDFDIFNRPCLVSTLSKSVSYAIILASAGLKLPIINNILAAKSTVGMSSSSVALETIALCSSFSSSLKKGLAFSLWGEIIIVYFQNLILLYLSRTFSNGQDPSIAIVGGIAGFTILALSLPASNADLLVAVATMISIASRIPQMMTNYQQKHTGVLSVVTQTLIVVGAVVRLATFAAETSDWAQIGSYLISLCLNGLLLVQVIVYWDASKKEMLKLREKKQE